jgi:hypothetical protein
MTKVIVEPRQGQNHPSTQGVLHFYQQGSGVPLQIREGTTLLLKMFLSALNELKVAKKRLPLKYEHLNKNTCFPPFSINIGIDKEENFIWSSTHLFTQ